MNEKTQSGAVRLVVCVMCVVATVQMAGCTQPGWLSGDPAQITHTIERKIDELDARYESTEQAIISRLDQMDQTEITPDDPSRLAMDAMLAETRAMRSGLDAARVKLVQVARETEAITSGSSVVSDTLGRLSVFIPEPFRSPALLAAGLVAALWRARTMRKGLVSVVKSVDKVMDVDPEFASRFVKHADTLRTIQTDTAKRVIDQTLATRFVPHLPI